MDPVSAISISGTAIGGAAKVISAISVLKERYQRADLFFDLLENQLTTLKNALHRISEWQISSCSPRLVSESDTAIRGVTTLLLLLENRLQQMKIDGDGNLTKHGKLSMVYSHSELKAYTELLNGQLLALNVFQHAYISDSSLEQHDILDREEAIVAEAEEGISSLVVHDGVSIRTSRSSYQTDDLSLLSKNFDFDKDVLNSRVYRVAQRCNIRKAAALSMKRYSNGNQLPTTIEMTRLWDWDTSPPTEFSSACDTMDEDAVMPVKSARTHLPHSFTPTFSTLNPRAPVAVLAGPEDKELATNLTYVFRPPEYAQMENQRENQRAAEAWNVFFCGHPSSGKSTTLDCLNMYTQEGAAASNATNFFQGRRNWGLSIRDNLISSLVAMLGDCEPDELETRYGFSEREIADASDLQQRLQILELGPGFKFESETYEQVLAQLRVMWGKPKCRELMLTSSIVHLGVCANIDWFLEKSQTQDLIDLRPSDLDILHCYSPSGPAYNLVIPPHQVNEPRVRFIDTPTESRSDPLALWSEPKQANVVVIFIDVTGYARETVSGSHITPLAESFVNFERLVNAKDSSDTRFIVAFTHLDRLPQLRHHGDYALAAYYQQLKGLVKVRPKPSIKFLELATGDVVKRGSQIYNACLPPGNTPLQWGVWPELPDNPPLVKLPTRPATPLAELEANHLFELPDTHVQQRSIDKERPIPDKIRWRCDCGALMDDIWWICNACGKNRTTSRALVANHVRRRDEVAISSILEI